MAHGSQIVDLIRSNLIDELGEVGGVREVTVVEEKADLFMMAITVQVLDTRGVEG